MKRIEQPLDGLIVVDAHAEDYDVLVAELEPDDVGVRVFSSGEDALRASRISSSALWMVNLRLPDMSGIGFLKLIRRRWRRSSVFLVGDTYSAVDELAARAAGATAYFCKPPSAAWLEGFRLIGRAPAIRAPTATLPGAATALHPP